MFCAEAGKWPVARTFEQVPPACRTLRVVSTLPSSPSPAPFVSMPGSPACWNAPVFRRIRRLVF